jgi:hypothetical protein
MIDFNNPYLTKQAKQSILSSVAQGCKFVPITEENICKGRVSFASHWILSMRDLCDLNRKGIEKLDFNFSLLPKALEKHHPDFSVILFESDRVEKGEWDNCFCRWESVGFQHTLVIGFIGRVTSFFADGFYFDEDYVLPDSDSLIDYPGSVNQINSGNRYFPIGLADFPLIDLREYEEYRHYQRISTDALDRIHNDYMLRALNIMFPNSYPKNDGNKKRFPYKGFGN